MLSDERIHKLFDALIGRRLVSVSRITAGDRQGLRLHLMDDRTGDERNLRIDHVENATGEIISVQLYQEPARPAGLTIDGLLSDVLSE
jgi:hypothetical protein